ncbi:hypothetical protein BC834DRAFT_911664 [Gloeopeniophorella convolvens]|nr:hypothetical protein BC834DRAFT_911664 [Gloeopeniophorella convolvens]
MAAPYDLEGSAWATDEAQGPDPRGAKNKLWTNYLHRSHRLDQNLVDNWKGDADGVLIFTGLFSATVATFVVESYRSLQQDSGETTVSLLLQISQQIAAGGNGTAVLPATIPAFHPKPSAVYVNILWFTSLCLSLTCALVATLVQQWARRYLQLAHGRYEDPGIRSIIRGFLHDGVSRFQVSKALEVMPLLLHIAVFLFFIGLIGFALPIHRGVGFTILAVVLCIALVYMAITALPLMYLNSPYQTPLTPFIWRLTKVIIVFLGELPRVPTAYSPRFKLPRFLRDMHSALLPGALLVRMRIISDILVDEMDATEASHRALSPASSPRPKNASSTRWTC